MSEGASSSSDAAVRLSMKRSSDSSNSESETKRPHTDHPTRGGSDASHAVERCWKVCRRKGTFLVDVNDWDCESRDNLRACGSEGTTVACSSGGATKELMSNEPRLLDFLAAICRGKREVCTSTQMWYPGGWTLRRVRPSSGPSCQDGGERLHRQEGVYDVVPRSDAAEKGCRVIRTRWVTVNKGSDDAPQLRAGWVA